jgi:hypothetical protein
VSDDDFLRVEANDCPMSSCAAPAGSPCRTGKGKVAVQYHTARFRLVPYLAKVLAVSTGPVRRPGSVWVELPRPVAVGVEPAGHARIGYARASTVRQSLDPQLESLRQAGVTRVFSEKISTRAVSRPELERAVALAREMRASGVAVTLVVHEHKRLGRGIELAGLAEQLQAAGARAAAAGDRRRAAEFLDPISGRGQCALFGRRGTEYPDQGIEPVGRRQHLTGEVLPDDRVRPPGLGG